MRLDALREHLKSTSDAPGKTKEKKDGAKDGYEAVERLDADPDFNLVILDLSMPGMDGRKVLDRIRGSKDTAALPVLVSTAFGGEEVETELLEAGADDFLEKTGDAKRFLARVKAVLRRAMM